MSIFLMGVYDPNTFRWCTVTKCGNGLDDKLINRLQRELDVKKISRVGASLLLCIFWHWSASDGRRLKTDYSGVKLLPDVPYGIDGTKSN